MKTFSRLFLLPILLFPVLHSAAQCTSVRYIDTVFASHTLNSQVKYGSADPYGLLSNQDLYLDLYEPAGNTLSARPLIIYQFGGAYQIGDKRQPPIPEYGAYFARLGYVFAAIDYRIGFNTLDGKSAERAVYRAIQDVRAAMRFLGQRASLYRIDTTAIILTGSSAGCVTSFHTAFFKESDRPASTFGIPLENVDLGCMDCSGNNDNGGRSFRPLAIVNQWGAILDTSYIDATDQVPVVSFHGTQDNIVPYVSGPPFNLPIFPSMHGTLLIHRRLERMGIPNLLIPLNGFGHEPELLNPELKDTVLDYSRRFLYDVLKPAPLRSSGPSHVCSGDTAVFSVQLRPGSRYCWTVPSGVQIIGTPSNTLRLFFPDSGSFNIGVKEISRRNVEGELLAFSVRCDLQPHAAFSYSTSELSIQLQDGSFNVDSLLLELGDGRTIYTADTGFFYTSPGTYRLRMQVFNEGCSDDYSVWVSVDTCPRANYQFLQIQDSVLFSGSMTNSSAFIWNFGDGQSAGGRLQVHRYANPGTYTVQLIVQNSLGCADTFSREVIYTGGSLVEDQEEGLFSLSPNPTDQWLSFTGSALKGREWKIIDGSGKLIRRGKCSGKPERIDVSELASGTYSLLIEEGNEKPGIVKKWIRR